MLLAALAASAQQHQPGAGVNFYSKTAEIAAGQQMASQFRHDATPLGNAAAGDYVNRLGAALAAQFPGGWAYQFEVVRENTDGTTLEPAAFPGGPIFISAELIAAARNEAEFAAMLAHAMAHVAERHWTKNATRFDIMQTGFAPPPPGAAVRVPLGMIEFQRQFERQADYVAVNATAAAGYDPQGLASYLERMQPMRRAEEGAFDPLPPRAERVKAIRGAIAKLPARSYQLSDKFAAVQALVAQH
ncbi:MAG: M48 family metalloprotease [Bryobacteraceae bacterium]